MIKPPMTREEALKTTYGGGDMEKEIYVVVAENDQPHKMPNRDEQWFDDGGPLVFEQYTRTADLESIKKRAAQIQVKYGKCRIAKLQFVDV